MNDRELQRQAIHFVIGIFVLFMLLHQGRGFTMAAVFFTIIIGTLLMNAKLLGVKIFFVDWFVEKLERENAPLPGWGSACYATGVLILLTFLSDINQMAACITILALGDSVSTVIGSMGRMKIPYNREKTLEGTIAFIIFSLPAYYFVGPMAIPLALVGAVAESLPWVDDNLTIPIACAALLLIL